MDGQKILEDEWWGGEEDGPRNIFFSITFFPVITLKLICVRSGKKVIVPNFLCPTNFTQPLGADYRLVL
jgi:hypothetical protein